MVARPLAHTLIIRSRGEVTREISNLMSSLSIPSVSLGYTTVNILGIDELEEAQTGYSVDPYGNTLVGEGEGSWKVEWLVIGYEDLCGDPIFIDTEVQGYPVYTAAHGEENWQARQIAATLETFAKAVGEIATVAKGRENPVQLEANPITPKERSKVLTTIREDNPDINLEFWELWLTDER